MFFLSENFFGVPKPPWLAVSLLSRFGGEPGCRGNDVWNTSRSTSARSGPMPRVGVMDRLLRLSRLTRLQSLLARMYPARGDPSLTDPGLKEDGAQVPQFTETRTAFTLQVGFFGPPSFSFCQTAPRQFGILRTAPDPTLPRTANLVSAAVRHPVASGRTAMAVRSNVLVFFFAGEH